jgi:hypothetical protein
MRPRRAPVVLAIVVLVACGSDGGDGENGPAGATSADCVETWVEALNGVDPGDIDADFQLETSASVAGAEDACPFDDLTPVDQSRVFADVDADVREALKDAGVIGFEPTGEPIE